MKHGKIFKSIICVVILCVTLSGCTTFDSFKHTFFDNKIDESKSIYIGVFEPKTGKNADSGLAEIKGIKLANSIYSSVDGYKVNLIEVDTQSSVGATETAIQGLIKMNPVAIIGSAGEATSLVASKYIDNAKIPAITPSSINPLVTQNGKYYFRVSLTNAQMGAGAGDYACNHKKSRHIGIITPKNDTLAAALEKGFKDVVKSSLGKDNDAIVLDEEINVDEKSMNSIAEKMVRNGVDILYTPFGTEVMDQFFAIMEERDLTDVTFMGNKDWGTEEFVQMMKKHPKINVAFPFLSVVDVKNMSKKDVTEEAERFRIEYANLYGDNDTPTDASALGYDSYLLLINAIHKSNSLKGTDIRKALLSLKGVKCATGVFRFDNNGNTVREVNIATIKDGEITSLHLTKDTTTAEEIGGIK